METDDSCCCRQQEQKIPQQFRGHVQWPAVPGTTVADTILIHRNEFVSYFLFFHTDDRKIAIERTSGVVIRVLKTRLDTRFVATFMWTNVCHCLVCQLPEYIFQLFSVQQINPVGYFLFRKRMRNTKIHKKSNKKPISTYCVWLSSSVHIVIFVEDLLQVFVFFLCVRSCRKWCCSLSSKGIHKFEQAKKTQNFFLLSYEEQREEKK